MKMLPGNDDEAIESVPRFCQVSSFAVNSHGDHFDWHFHGEEGEDKIVQHLSALTTTTDDDKLNIVWSYPYFTGSCCYLEDSASIGVADLVDTRLVHAQRDAVEENDGHADPLEPRVEFSKS